MKNYYKVLEVDLKASPEVIRAAHRQLVKKYKEDTPALELLKEAKSHLFVDDKRAAYDKELNKSKKVGTGTIVGEYRLVEEIASGGFATTYLAEHVMSGLPVCVKHAHEISPVDEELMLQEVEALWDLRHWAIPAVRGVVRLDDDSVAIIMSYIPGPTLAQLVDKTGGLDAEHVCWIAERVLNALRYMHDHAVVHGDVKPQNIIIQPDIEDPKYASHNVVLVDYGLSLIRPRSDTAAKGYTRAFASPEQKKEMPLIPESDLYGLGVTMIYALGGDIKALRVPADTPDSLCVFIRKLVSYDPLNRPNWNKEDLCKSISDVRQKSFGRRSSELRRLKL